MYEKILENPDKQIIEKQKKLDIYPIASFIPVSNMTDWYDEHHFDHRHLIEKNLAIEAPEHMYNYDI